MTLNSRSLIIATFASGLATLALATGYNQTFAGKTPDSEFLSNVGTGAYYMCYALTSITTGLLTAAAGALVVDEISSNRDEQQRFRI